MKKAITLIILVALAFSSIGSADEINFSWTYDFQANPDVHKFQVYKDSQPEVNATLDVCTLQQEGSMTRVRYMFPCENCSRAEASYYVTAIDDAGQESPPSESITLNPAPDKPGSFSVEFRITVSGD